MVFFWGNTFESRLANGRRKGTMDTDATIETTPESSDETTDEVSTEWTVMGYLAGDNNLNEEMVLTLQEILDSQERHGDDLWPRVKILAQLDPSGLGLPTQRFVFDTPNKELNEKRYLKTYKFGPPADYSEINTGNPKALSGFVKWAVEEDPHKAKADRYMLVLSGHGSGTTEDFLMKDDNPVDSLSIPELEEALAEITETLGKLEEPKQKKKNIDLLGMDSCFMSMVEVCYQIRNYVDYVVGAESMVPDFGWPYHLILARAMALRQNLDRAVNADELADLIVREFIECYSDYDRTAGRSVDMASIELQEIGVLRDRLVELGDLLCVALDDPDQLRRILLAHWEAQTYKFDQFVDIKDFCDRLIDRFKSLAIEPESGDGEAQLHPVSQKCSEVETALRACVGISGCSGFAYQHSYGLSIYLPWAYVSDSYGSLAFAKISTGSSEEESGWMKFLRKYVTETRRDPRTEGAIDIEEIQLAEEEEDSGYFEEAVNAISESLSPGQARKHLKSILRSRFRRHDLGGSGDLPAGSRYHRSRYHRSRYHRSRWPGDREKSMKNFTPVVGTAYWEP